MRGLHHFTAFSRPSARYFDDFAVLRRGFVAVEALVLRALLAGACLGAACFVTTPVSGAAFAEAAFAGFGLAAFFGAALTSVAKEGSGAACLRVVEAAFLRAVLGAALCTASAAGFARPGLASAG